MKGLLLLVGLVWMSAGAVRAQNIFSSVYTDMKKDCAYEPAPSGEEEGGDPAAFCTGYGGYRIYMYFSANSAVVGVMRTSDAADVMTLGTERVSYGDRGEKIEWRTASGKPFAVIMRVTKYRDGVGGAAVGSTLVVRGLPGWEHIRADIDGSLPDANARARAAADAGWKKRR